MIIAEAGVNHNGDPELARRMVRMAAEAGADAIKFQTFRAELLASSFAPKARYQVETTGAAESQVDMLRGLELQAPTYRELFELCTREGIEFVCTPFDPPGVDLLVDLGVRRIKVPSGEMTNLPFLEYVGAKGVPVVLSTGMSYLGEVETAVRSLLDAGCPGLTLLHCTSSYPADPAEANLRAMVTLRQAFGLPVGYSDHTPGLAVACAAVALGATMIEKHFTLDKSLPGPDHRSSLDVGELRSLVSAVRQVTMALGDGRKRPTAGELNTREVARRSLVAARDLAAGTTLCAGDVAIKRPGTGIPPAELRQIVGRRVRVAVRADEPLDWSHFA